MMLFFLAALGAAAEGNRASLRKQSTAFVEKDVEKCHGDSAVRSLGAVKYILRQRAEIRRYGIYLDRTSQA